MDGVLEMFTAQDSRNSGPVAGGVEKFDELAGFGR